jgi:hypothetical protein
MRYVTGYMSKGVGEVETNAKRESNIASIDRQLADVEYYGLQASVLVCTLWRVLG